MGSDRLPLVSVVVFVRARDTKVMETLASLGHQRRFAEIEVLLADGCPERRLDGVAQAFAWVRHLWHPGENMPRLKAHAIAAARGEVVAILDPWDAAPPDWIDEMLAGLEDPEVTAVGGAVELDGPPSPVNRAAYLFEYGAFNPPFNVGPTDGELPGNNLAVRRAVLRAQCADILDSVGFIKPFCQARLRERGGRLVMRPSLRVGHLTDHRFGPFARRRFHYARCFGATRVRRSELTRALIYRAVAPLVPALLVYRHVTRARQHPANRRLLAGALPALVGICLVWGFGEWLGCWLGPGRSCDELF